MVLALVKVSLIQFGEPTRISLNSLSGDGVSNLPDLLILPFPILLK